jgi:hypothetical protein
MKELSFEIAKKIASDNSKNTVIICCSILKEAFIMEGLSNKQANTMAIDAVKIILKTMVNIGKKI